MAHMPRHSIIHRNRSTFSSLVLFVIIVLVALANTWTNSNSPSPAPTSGPVVLQPSSDDQPGGEQSSDAQAGDVQAGSVQSSSEPVGNESAADKEKKPTKTPTRASTAKATVAANPRATASATSTPTPKRRATATPTRHVTRSQSGLPLIYYEELPPEAHDTIQLIDEGGPFPFYKDGSDFQNREGILPRKPRGYYREYTVITPREDDRGARRIVEGADGELYYTDDHYDSFSEVVR